MSDIVTAHFEPLGEFSALVVPQWVQNPTVLPLQTHSDRLIVKVSRRYTDERWVIWNYGQMSALICFRQLGGGQLLGNPLDVKLEVHVPIEVYPDFTVTPFKP